MDSNVIVMISGEGTTLQALIDKCNIAKIVGVLSDQPKAGGIKRAQTAKIPHIMVVSKDKNETKEHHSDRMKNAVDIATQMNDNVRYIVLAGFMRVLTPDFIHHFKEKNIDIINIHPSLLPKHKGLHTYKRVLEDGDESHGTTIHYVNEEVDGGKIIFQESFYIKDMDNEKTLEKKTRELEQKYYPKVIDSLFTGDVVIT